MKPSDYSFRPMTAGDLPLIAGWLRQPHVAEWWDAGDLDEPRETLDDHHTWPFIVHLGERPIGYIQAYDPHVWPGHHFSHLPPGSRGVDQYIGEADCLNQGHGTAFIRAFCDRLFAEGAPAIGTDPDPTNARAIRVYEKAGFRIIGGPVDTDWGRCLLMAREKD